MAAFRGGFSVGNTADSWRRRDQATRRQLPAL